MNRFFIYDFCFDRKDRTFLTACLCVRTHVSTLFILTQSSNLKADASGTKKAVYRAVSPKGSWPFCCLS